MQTRLLYVRTYVHTFVRSQCAFPIDVQNSQVNSHNNLVENTSQVRKSEEVKHRLVIRQQELSTGSITDEVTDSMDIIDTAEEVYAQLMDSEEDGINTSIVLRIGADSNGRRHASPPLLGYTRSLPH